MEASWHSRLQRGYGFGIAECRLLYLCMGRMITWFAANSAEVYLVMKYSREAAPKAPSELELRIRKLCAEAQASAGASGRRCVEAIRRATHRASSLPNWRHGAGP